MWGRLLKLGRAIFPLWFSLLTSSSPDLLSFFTLCPKYVSRISLSDGVSAEIWIRLETETQMKFCKISKSPPKERKGYIRTYICTELHTCYFWAWVQNAKKRQCPSTGPLRWHFPSFRFKRLQWTPRRRGSGGKARLGHSGGHVHPYLLRPAFLASTLGTFGAGKFTVEGNCPACCRVFSSITGFYPQDASNTPFPAVTTENTHTLLHVP